MIDYLIRAESRAVWQTYAQERGWIGEDGHPTAGTLIDEIGPVVITPGTYDPETGDETTPPVMDDWHHINLRLTADSDPEATQFPGGKTVDVRGVSALEVGVEPTRLQVLDASGITTPVRIWADGMHFTPTEGDLP